jgi:hypothetical protein
MEFQQGMLNVFIITRVAIQCSLPLVMATAVFIMQLEA